MSFFLSNSRSCSVYPAERRLLMSVTRSQAEEATGGGVGGDICRSVGDHGNIMGIWWEYLGIWWKSDGNLWACCFWWGYRWEKYSYPEDIWWETKSMVIQKIYLDLRWFCFVSQWEIHYGGMCFFVERGLQIVVASQASPANEDSEWIMIQSHPLLVNQWPIQVPKIEVLYHIRLNVVGIFP